jgi:muconate cycloisomerase
MLCGNTNTDIYELLGRPPERDVIIYGGTLPIMPLPAAEKLLNGYNKMGIGSLRIKMDRNTERNEATVRLARRILGQDYDLRIDANAGWTVEYAAGIIPFLNDEGISIIEEPFGRISPGEQDPLRELIAGGNAEGITFMADESALTIEDIRKAAIEGTFSMINIRLAKNGGILRALSMAEEAEKLGIRYQAGCHVGETGILSAAGRAAASMMKKPEYTDGSYDSHLLSGNITAEDISFEAGGRGRIITGKGLGFQVDEKKLKGFTDEKLQCF